MYQGKRLFEINYLLIVNITKRRVYGGSMRACFENEFERRLAKAVRKHCDKVHTLGQPWIGYWQFVYKGETVFGMLDIYDKLVDDQKITPFSESVIEEYL